MYGCRGTLDSNPERVRDFGREVEVQWNDESFYRGTVKMFDVSSNLHTVLYEGGQVEKVNLRITKHKWLTGGSEGQLPLAGGSKAPEPKKRAKKRRPGRPKIATKKIKVEETSKEEVKTGSDKENNAPVTTPHTEEKIACVCA